MHLDHFALWTPDLERLRAFYERYFGAQASAQYTNPHTGFQSYFLSFASGARLEIMTAPQAHLPPTPAPRAGYAHLAVAVGSTAQVDALTATLRAAGYAVLSGPRRTGDGYYESVILDPDGNHVEITV